MKHVFRIAIKDFRIQLKSILSYLITGLALILLISMISPNQIQMVYAVAVFAIIYGFVNKALYEDEKNNTLRLLVSLPLKRDVIVCARYLSTGVYIISLCLVMFLITLFSGFIRNSPYESAIIIILASTFMVFFIMLSLYLPLAFKLGYIKAAGINRFIFLGIFAFFGAVSFALTGVVKSKGPDFMQKLEEFISSMDPVSVFAGLVLFVVLVYLVSMGISIRLFRKRVLF